MGVSLARISVYNFRSFAGRHDLELPPTGFVLVHGDSGHGKSNLLLAAAYALGACPLPATALQNWHNDDPFWVEVEFRAPDGVYVLRRGPKTRSLETPTATITGSSAAVEAGLEALLGIPPTVREFLTYRDQFEPMQFLGLSDKDVKSLMTKVLRGGDLSLDRVETEIKTRAEALGPIRKAAEAARQALEARRQTLAVVEAQGEGLGLGSWDPVQEVGVAQEVVAEAQEAVAAALKTWEEAAAAVHQAQAGRQAAVAAAAAQYAPQLAAAREAEAAAHAHTPTIEVDRTRYDELTAALEACSQYLAHEQREDAGRRGAWDQETERQRMALRHLHQDQATIPRLVDDLRNYQQELERLEASTCPTCEQKWVTAQAHAVVVKKKIEETQARLADLRSKAPEIAAAEETFRSRSYQESEQLTQLLGVRDHLKQELLIEQKALDHAVAMGNAQHAARLTQLRLARTELEMQLDAVRKKIEAEDAARMQELMADAVRTCQEHTKAEAELANARRAAADAEAHAAAYEAAQRERKARIDQIRGDVRADEEAVRLLDEQVARESDYLDMIRGFYNKVFDEFLHEAGAEATTLLAAIPNADRLSLEFRSEYETGSDTVRSRFTPVVHVDGHPRTLREALSGGQTTSARLAADLGVIGVITRRLGGALNWLILDETFSGHNPATKQACMDVLRQCADDKLVLVVDHTSETQDLFDKKIKVTMGNDKESRIS